MNIAEKIVQLRQKAHMTQAACAEKFGVTRQAIQKWESGAVVPELENLIRISQLFGVSLDYIVGCGNRRNEEILYQESKVSPDYSQLNVWAVMPKICVRSIVRHMKKERTWKCTVSCSIP